jgi:hypothetical protein
MLVLKSMRKADNVRETIELAVPVCGVNSLCIVCIILIQAPACMLHHLAMDTQAQPPGTVTVKHPLPVLNASGIIPLPYEHAQAPILEHEFVIARYQPILAALALPFPLVCSIVCIVAAVRNRRVMVSSFFMHTHTHDDKTRLTVCEQDIAVSIFLAYASRRFQAASSSASDDYKLLPEGRASMSMGSLALAMAASACMGLAAYRMAYGDDHGHAHQRLWTQGHLQNRPEQKGAGANKARICLKKAHKAQKTAERRP